MTLKLEDFVAASRGYSTEEICLQRGQNQDDSRPHIRSKLGMLFVNAGTLKAERSDVAHSFIGAIKAKIAEVKSADFISLAEASCKTLYERNLKNIEADLEASLCLQLRGDRALTANDIQTLALRLDDKLTKTLAKAARAVENDIKVNFTSTLDDARARQTLAWASLCPNTSFPTTDYAAMKDALKTYFQTRPDVDSSKLDLIDARLEQEANFTADSDPVKRALALAKTLESLHEDLLGYPLDLAVTPYNSATLDELVLNGEKKVAKRFTNGKAYQLTLDAKDLSAELKLKRAPEVTSSYLRDREKDFIIAPSHFLVKETIPGVATKKWLVEVRDKEFRAWAKDQLFKNSKVTDYRLEIVGNLQDKAEGVNLDEALVHNRLKGDMIKPITFSYINALSAMAKRGFVHGDIKPGTTFFDPATNRLKLIDTGGMAKISKKNDRRDATLWSANRGHTSTFSLPNVNDGLKASFEQDLYSAGVSILSISLTQRGELENFPVIITTNKKSIERYLNEYIMPNATPEELIAVDMIKKAIYISSVGSQYTREEYLTYLEGLKERLSPTNS